MAGIKYTGICSICGGCFRKSETKDHLERCLEEDRKKQLANGAKISTLFRILVKSEHKEYWLNLEASSDATLSDLDLLLRKVWLECCSHESYFTIKRTIYTSSADALFIHEGLAVRLGEVLQPGLIFEYVYGSLWGGLKSTELQLKVLSMRVGPAGAGPNGFIRVLTRNVPPNLRCFCGEPAITVCTACSDLHMHFCSIAKSVILSLARAQLYLRFPRRQWT